MSGLISSNSKFFSKLNGYPIKPLKSISMTFKELELIVSKNESFSKFV
jgi:hypothetical protein